MCTVFLTSTAICGVGAQNHAKYALRRARASDILSLLSAELAFLRRDQRCRHGKVPTARRSGVTPTTGEGAVHGPHCKSGRGGFRSIVGGSPECEEAVEVRRRRRCAGGKNEELVPKLPIDLVYTFQKKTWYMVVAIIRDVLRLQK
jgi:hypothetical protein